MKHLTEPRIGVDVGRVLVEGLVPGADTSFFTGDDDDLVATPAVAGALEGLAWLVDQFDGRVWLVSKCGPRIEQRTLRWLSGNDVYTRTGLNPAQVRFCRARPDKALHARQLRLTHFVDDRRDVHVALAGLVTHRYLFGPQKGPIPDGCVATLTWPDVIWHVMATVPVRT
ncbi:MAG: hypothetical protein FWF02_05875 [Micrococcales bacterium]|nr:hypothetical protein [Micrococcales bacterium]MCL2667220.1 hypothetical protein [Micrococcales bacterium]